MLRGLKLPDTLKGHIFIFEDDNVNYGKDSNTFQSNI